LSLLQLLLLLVDGGASCEILLSLSLSLSLSHLFSATDERNIAPLRLSFIFLFSPSFSLSRNSRIYTFSSVLIYLTRFGTTL
jgi:hypothetical protein